MTDQELLILAALRQVGLIVAERRRRAKLLSGGLRRHAKLGVVDPQAHFQQQPGAVKTPLTGRAGRKTSNHCAGKD
jgi:hypothetical protein